MRMKAALISLVVVVAIAVLICLGMRLFFGAKIEMRRSKMQLQKKDAPLGVVRAIGSESSKNALSDSVGIRVFNDIYAAIGVTRQEFERWESEHGTDSFGTDTSGKMLAPGYPIFSKVAWMYIDPVTLTPEETSDLVRECERAMLNTANESAKQELEAVRALAEEALSNSAVIQFGHP